MSSAAPRGVARHHPVVAFSDGVFAITITLLVLEIRPPTDDENLLHGLVALWPSYLAYAVTFLFIGQVWANHHVMFDHIRAADRIVLRGFYGIAFGVTALTFNAVWQYARRHRLLSDVLDSAGATAISSASSSPWPGSRPVPCSAPWYRSWAWP